MTRYTKSMSEILEEVDEIAKTIPEVAPPGWGHTVAKKEKTKPNKPKSKIGGTAHEFDKDLKSGKFKGLPGDKTAKDRKASMFKLMWSMKNKGDKPHYKPGVKDKLKSQYKEEVEESNLPPHLSKFLDKDGNPNKEAQARIDAGRKKRAAAAAKPKITDVTPKGYGPSEEVEMDEARPSADHPWRSTPKQRIQRKSDIGKYGARVAAKRRTKGPIGGGKVSIPGMSKEEVEMDEKSSYNKMKRAEVTPRRSGGEYEVRQGKDMAHKLERGKKKVPGKKAERFPMRSSGPKTLEGPKGKLPEELTPDQKKKREASRERTHGGKSGGSQAGRFGQSHQFKRQAHDADRSQKKPDRNVRKYWEKPSSMRAGPKGKLPEQNVDEWGDTSILSKQQARIAGRPDIGSMDNKPHRKLKITQKGLDALRADRDRPKVKTQVKLTKKGRDAIKDEVEIDELTADQKYKREGSRKRTHGGSMLGYGADKLAGPNSPGRQAHQADRGQKKPDRNARKYWEPAPSMRAGPKGKLPEGRFASAASDPRIGGSSSVDTVPDFALKAKKGATSAPGSGSIAKPKKAKASDVNKSIEQQMADAMKESTWSKNFKAKAAERRGETKRRREAERDSPGQRVPPKQKDEEHDCEQAHPGQTHSKWLKTQNEDWQGIREAQWKVKLKGLPTFYVPGKSAGAIRQMLRKQLKRPMDDIEDIIRATPAAKKKDFRTRAQGKEDSAVVSGKS